MSSHREAPQISTDPVADSTDLYAFVSPDRPDHVTIIANYIPLESPDGGPNFYEFGEDVLYEIHIDNDGDGFAEITYQFRFTTFLDDADTFLYNTGPILSLGDTSWNRKQSYSVTRINQVNGKVSVLGDGLMSPPCNIGPLSTPNYGKLALAAVHHVSEDTTVFCGQRAEGFYVDLGAIFDLAILRPFQQDHTTFGLENTGLGMMAAGINSTKALNVHSIALQVPKTELTANGRTPSSISSSQSTVGIWTTASRQKVVIADGQGGAGVRSGPFAQVSRLGNPLVNEVVIPMSRKNFWNIVSPHGDSQFAQYYLNPELSQLLPGLYPGVFPNLQKYNAGHPHRDDLVAILLTGIPEGVVEGFQNFTGSTQADMLRLNMAIPPTKAPSNLGLIGGDPAGFPNGRRVFDDVVTIELRAFAGATLPLVDPSFTPDGAAGAITPGLTSSPTDLTAKGTENYLSTFPYLGAPHQGFLTPAS